MKFVSQLEIDTKINKCMLCNNALDVPKLLTCCAETICQKCELENFQIGVYEDCPLCDELILYEKPFPINKSVEKILNLHVVNENKYFKEAKQALVDYQEKYDGLQALINNPDEFVFEHFSKLKESLNERANELITSIEEKRENLLKQIQNHEEECKSYITSTDRLNFEKYKTVLNQYIEDLKSNEPCIPNDCEMNKKQLNDLKTKIKQLDFKIDHYLYRIQTELLNNKNLKLTFFNYNIYDFFDLSISNRMESIEFFEPLKIVTPVNLPYLKDNFKLINLNNDLNLDFLTICVEENYYDYDSLIKKITNYYANSTHFSQIKSLNDLDQASTNFDSYKEFATEKFENSFKFNNSFEVLKNKLKDTFKFALDDIDFKRLIFDKLFNRKTSSKHTFNLITSNEMDKLKKFIEDNSNLIEIDCLTIDHDLEQLDQVLTGFESLIDQPNEFIEWNLSEFKREIENKLKIEVDKIQKNLQMDLKRIELFENDCKNCKDFQNFKPIADSYYSKFKHNYQELLSIENTSDLTEKKDKLRLLLQELKVVSMYIKNMLMKNTKLSYSNLVNFEKNMTSIKYFDSFKLIDFKNNDYNSHQVLDEYVSVDFSHVSECFKEPVIDDLFNQYPRDQLEKSEIFLDLVEVEIDNEFYEKDSIDKNIVEDLYKYNLKDYRNMIEKLDFLNCSNLILRKSGRETFQKVNKKLSQIVIDRLTNLHSFPSANKRKIKDEPESNDEQEDDDKSPGTIGTNIDDKSSPQLTNLKKRYVAN